MKKTLGLLAILLTLGVVYYLLPKGEEQTTSINHENRNFITQDIEEVYTITIESKGRPTIHLSRAGDSNKWLINRKHYARTNIMSNMLMVLSNMSLQYIPRAPENKTALERIKKFGMGIKTYDKNGKVLTDFILGQNTNSEYGTYLKSRTGQQTYVMSLPASEGGLRGFFNQDVEVLRDLMIIDIPAEEIQQVKVSYPKDKKNSFTIIRDEQNLKFVSSQEEYKNKTANANFLDAYLKDFKTVYAERLRNGHFYKDSIKSLVPFMTLDIDLVNGKNVKLDTWPFVDLESNYVTRSPKDVTIRHDRFYLSSSRGDFYQVQKNFLTPFMKKVADFY